MSPEPYRTALYDYSKITEAVRAGAEIAAGQVVDLRTGRRFFALIVFHDRPDGQVDVMPFGEALDSEACNSLAPVFEDGSMVPSTPVPDEEAP